MPIPVPQGDPLYSRFNVKCLKFDRTPAAIRPKCLLGKKSTINHPKSILVSPKSSYLISQSFTNLSNRLTRFESSDKHGNFAS